MTQLLSKSLRTQLARVHIWNMINLFESYRRLVDKITVQNIPIYNICVQMLCRFSDTEIIIWRQKHVGKHVAHKTQQIFSTMHVSPLSLRNLTCQFRLRNV